ncbi:MAG TPA: PD-(D/E)XK nuclease family protein [Anaerolineales bacterium]|nr:PD-(D/E)XK nuclease family protein [Anaerolineales bacterium]
MPMELTTLSQSSLQDYSDCPRRFELRYLQRLAYPALESEPALENEKHQREGEYFHRLAQQAFIGLPLEHIAKLANSENLQRWWDNFSNAPDVQSLLSMPLRRTEVTLSAPLGNFRLLAKFDLIAAHDGKFFIYDWKTYRKRPRNEWLAVRWQTRVYRALLVQAGAHLHGGKAIQPEQVEMVYWFPEFPNEAAHLPYQSDQYKRDRDALTRLAEEIASASGYPKTEEAAKCLYCPYRSYCNRGARAGDALEAELETEAEEIFDLNFEQIGEIEF